MTVKDRASRARSIGRSPEVQHGRRGVARMLRRGLYGAKNWVLEPDDDGLQRSPWTKVLRVLVLLLPLWILLSATTGGPERGGQEVSVVNAIVFALLMTFGGLGWLSARERRLGREEPWADLPPVDTFSDSDEPKTLIDPASEALTEVLEKEQVSEVAAAPEGPERVVTPGDIPDVSDQRPQNGAAVATPLVATPLDEEAKEAPFDLVSRGDRPSAHPSQALATPGDEPGIPDALEEETPTVPLKPGHPSRQAATTSLEKAASPQVKAYGEVTTQVTGGSLPPVTDGYGSGGVATPVWPEPAPPLNGTQEELFPQAAGVATPLATPTPGPYPVSDDPLAGDWWLTKPDTEAEGDATEGNTEEATEETPVEADRDEVEGGQGADPVLDQAVLEFRAVRSMPDAPEELKERVRLRAAQWAREELDSGRQSQRGVARTLGVSKTTVSKWLERETDPQYDPWADEEDD